MDDVAGSPSPEARFNRRLRSSLAAEETRLLGSPPEESRTLTLPSLSVEILDDLLRQMEFTAVHAALTARLKERGHTLGPWSPMGKGTEFAGYIAHRTAPLARSPLLTCSTYVLHLVAQENVYILYGDEPCPHDALGPLYSTQEARR